MATTTSTTTTPPPKLQSLDETLGARISTPDRWRLFLNLYVDPLRRIPNTGAPHCPDKRSGFPAPDPLDANPLAFSVDRVHFYSMMYTGKRLLYYTAILYHLEQLGRARNRSLNNNDNGPMSLPPLLREYDLNYRESTYLSMTRSTKATETNCTGSDYLWRNNLYFDTHEIESFHMVPRDQLYRWQIYTADGQPTDQRVNSFHSTDKFLAAFSPLEYYQWFPPDTVVRDWSFSLDANSYFIYTWYANYLSRVSTYDEMVKNFATASARVQELERTKETNARKFHDLIRTISDKYLSRDSYNAKYNMTSDTNQGKQIREFNRQLEQLYLRFRSTLGQ